MKELINPQTTGNRENKKTELILKELIDFYVRHMVLRD